MRLLLVTNDYPPKAGGIQQYLGNLVENIAPTRDRASVILRKGPDHRVTDVRLRRH